MPTPGPTGEDSVGGTSPWESSKLMDSAQHCRDQAAGCLRLMKSARSKDQAEVLGYISSSWSRLAGQIDRYHALVREQGRIVRE